MFRIALSHKTKSKILFLLLSFWMGVGQAQDIQTLLKKVSPGILSDTIGYANTNFGYSTSISGNILVVGANFESSSYDGCDSTTKAGAAYVFYRDSSGTDNWGFVKMLTGGLAGFNGRSANDQFGISISISGDIIVVGATEQDYDSVGGITAIGAGAAYVFSKNSGGIDNWGFVKKLTGKGTNGLLSDDNFGVAVSVSGDVVVVGANGQSYDSAGGNSVAAAGAAYVFYKNSGGADNWGFVKKLTGKGTNGRISNDSFGVAVSISGDVVVVGANGQDYDSVGGNSVAAAGAAYVFYKNSGGTDNWGFVKKLTQGVGARGSNDIFGISVAIDNEIIIIGAPQHNYDSALLNSVSNAGAAYVFNKNSGGTDNWGLMKKITGKGTNSRIINDYFGGSVSISSDIIVVGAWGQDYDSVGGNSISNAGATFVFQRNSGGTDNWGFVKKITGKGTNGRAANDEFGHSVSVSGEVVVSGATGHDYNFANSYKVNIGSAFISYKNAGGTDNWGYVKKANQRTYFGRDLNKGFGAHVSVSGDVMVITATGDDYDTASNNFISGAGAAYVYHRNTGGDNNWGFVKKLTGMGINGRVSTDLFGAAASISGDVLVIGAVYQDYDSVGGNKTTEAGAAYVFHRNNGGTDNWGFVKKLTGKGTNGRISADYFGGEVSVSNDIIVVGASGQDYDSAGGNFANNAGAAYVFYRNSGGTDNWGFVKKLTGKGTNGRSADDDFGYSVSISDDIIAISARQQDYDSIGGGSLSNAGAAYIFDKNSGGIDNWGLVKKITGNGTNGRVASDFFGESIAIAQDIIVVGASLQDYDSVGGNSASAAGAAFVFHKNSGGTDNWGLVKKLTGKGTNGRISSDQFGRFVSASSDLIVVGIPDHGYDTAGGNFLNSAGAAYVYSRHWGGVDNWGMVKKLTGVGTKGRLSQDQFGTSVAVTDDRIAVGANGHSYDSAGGNFASGAGALWLFKDNLALIYNGSSWSPQAPSPSTSAYRAFVQAGTSPISNGANINKLTVYSGSTASLSGDFNIGGNYTNNGTVSGVGKVILNGSLAQNIYGTGTTGNLELNNSAGATIQDSLGINGILTLTAGTLTTNDKLKLEATGATTYGQIAGTGAGTLSGNLTAEMLITGGGQGWRPVCSPVSGATLAQINDDVSMNFGTPSSTYATAYYFNEQTSPYWTIASGTGDAFGDTAFSIYMGGSSSWSNPLPLTLDIQGSYRGTSDYTYTNLTRTGSLTDTTGWHYIANPWPSGFLWDDANITVNSGGIQGTQVWIYNQSAGAYQAFDGTNNGVIPPFHPLLVEVTTNNTGFTLKNSARTTDSLLNYFDKTGLQNLIEIQVADASGKTDKVKWYTDDNATNGYDIMDGNKRPNLVAPNLYFVLEGKKANKEVWNTLPEETEAAQLHFEAQEAGKYTISFITENLEANTVVMLEDKQSGAKHDIEKGNYTFTHDLNNVADRFELKFSKKSTTTKVEQVQTANVYVGSTGNTVTIVAPNTGNYTVEIIDLLGRTVQTPVTFTGNQVQTVTVNGVSAGYYLVKVKGDNVFKTAKVFLK